MRSNALNILAAKIALEIELVQPLAYTLSAYIETWARSDGDMRIWDRAGHQDIIERVLLNHYARVVSVMSGVVPTSETNIDSVALGPAHAASLRARAHNQMLHMVRGMDRDLNAALLALPYNPAAKSAATLERKSLQTKKQSRSVEYVGRFKETAKQAWHKLKGRLKAMVNIETEAVAEQYQIEWVKQKHANSRIWKRWQNMGDERVRGNPNGPYAGSAFDHWTAQGQEVPVDQPFIISDEKLMMPGDNTLGASLGNIINCFPGDTRVSGDILAATRHFYDGDIIEIATRCGHKLSGTPNHPILTPKGWVAIGALQEGDHVICCGLGVGDEGAVAAASERADVQHVEPVIEQVFDALAHGRTLVRMPRLAVNFHGDVPAEDVDIVRAEGVLRLGFEIGQDLDHFGFALSGFDEGLLLPDRADGEFVGTTPPSSGSSVGCSHNRLAFVGGSPLEPEDIGGAAAPCGEASFRDHKTYRGAAQASALGDTEHRFTAFEGGDDGGCFSVATSPIHKAVGGTGGPHDASGAQPLVGGAQADAGTLCGDSEGRAVAVYADQIAHRVVRYFSGHVYNLQTIQGFYTANGIVAHNCRCHSAYFIVGPGGERLDIPLQTPVIPAKRTWHHGDRLGIETPVRPTESITMTGRTRARVIMGDGRTFGTIQQTAPDTLVVRVQGRDIARATFSNGTVTSMTVVQGNTHLDVEGLIRRSVAATSRLQQVNS